MATITGNCLDCPQPVVRAPARSASAVVRFADSLGEWLRRGRSRRLLAQMDDRMLHDIGITRDTALSEHEKPFWRA
jgi:uncharacterized protein YjiS (DUF1127 family)